MVGLIHGGRIHGSNPLEAFLLCIRFLCQSATLLLLDRCTKWVALRRKFVMLTSSLLGVGQLVCCPSHGGHLSTTAQDPFVATEMI
jgi:hypothetical protein